MIAACKSHLNSEVGNSKTVLRFDIDAYYSAISDTLLSANNAKS